ncbi:Sterile alpha motif/pointed domain [Pseudocohnilembus persalinus]|uniref:Sterile alpha motif/pointed domain n=1 Tax=Pseudocohnilembus persalinus TaxID=266149 RepID=A0A0V0R000_PSEPJ|nr:Sterile alpha motif/pointed domain [Pseudocohnilembus persalinus]|eukprot:KRX07787.1 Sterile alpha motif/pointed domain [Pseudocohnilembus persalinus]
MDFNKLFELLPKYPMDWTESDTILWLRIIGKQQYQENFVDCQVDGSNLQAFISEPEMQSEANQFLQKNSENEEQSVQNLQYTKNDQIKNDSNNQQINYDNNDDVKSYTINGVINSNDLNQLEMVWDSENKKYQIKKSQDKDKENKYKNMSYKQIQLEERKEKFLKEREEYKNNLSKFGFQQFLNGDQKINFDIQQKKIIYNSENNSDEDDEMPELDMDENEVQYLKVRDSHYNISFFEIQNQEGCQFLTSQKKNENDIVINKDIPLDFAIIITSFEKRVFQLNKSEKLNNEDIYVELMLDEIEIQQNQSLKIKIEDYKLNISLRDNQIIVTQNINQGDEKNKKSFNINYQDLENIGKNTNNNQSFNYQYFTFGSGKDSDYKFGMDSLRIQPTHFSMVCEKGKVYLRRTDSILSKVFIYLSEDQQCILLNNMGIFLEWANLMITVLDKETFLKEEKCAICLKQRSIMGFYEECDHIVCDNCVNQNQNKSNQCVYCQQKTKQGWQIKF